MPNFLINITTRGAKAATSGMRKLSGSLMKLSKVAMVGAAGGALAMGVALKKATDAAAEQELQEKKLTQALGKNADALIKQAAALQQSSRFGDEAIIQQQAYLASIGMSEQQIREMIPVTMDLAAATGMSLESAVKNTAKTLSGMTGELGESVGSLRDLSAEELKAGEGINMMRELFKGAAEGEVKTLTGAMDQAKNAIGDAAEALGDIVAPLVTAGASMTKDFAEKAQEAFELIGEVDFKQTFQNIFKDISGLGMAILESYKAIWGLMPEIFRAAFNKILPIAKKILNGLITGIVNIGSFIFEPIVMAGKIMGVKIGNFFIDAINKIKDLYNQMASFIGLSPLDLTPRLSEEGLSMANTLMGEFMAEMSENNIATTNDLTTRLGEIWDEYGNKVVVKNEEVDESNKNSAKIVVKGEKAKGEATKATTKLTKESAIQAGLSAGTALSAIRQVIKAKFSEAIAGLLAREITSKGFLGVLLGAGYAGAATQLFESVVPKFAQGGDFITSGAQAIIVGDNESGRERVQITPLDAGGEDVGGGASSITLNISAPLVDETVVESIIPAIREAVRRGESLDS